MDLLVSVFVFIFGAIIGSFLNVVIFRYNTGRSVVTGRSSCLSCDRKLSWYNMLPLISFTVQKGRCATCYSKISWQYPIVELLSAVFTLVLYYRFGVSLFTAFYVVVFSILIIIAVYDLRHKIIPDALVYFLAVLSFLRLAYLYFNVSPEVAISGLKGGIMAFIFLGSFWFVSEDTDSPN